MLSVKQFQIARLWPILLSLLVAIVIWCWPAKPVWHVKSTDQLLGFCHDGQSVWTISTTEPGTTPQHAVLNFRDVKSGQITDSVPAILDGVTRNSHVSLSSDRKKLLVGNRGGDDETPQTDYFIMDARTGKQLSGPLPEVEHIFPDAFSIDGRWLWAYHKTSSPDEELQDVDILSVASGETVIQLPSDEIRFPRTCRFSKDGNQVAVLWIAKEESTDAVSQIRLLEVPSGREIRCLELPSGQWERFHSWDDRAMTLEFNVSDGNAGHFRRCRAFDLTSPTLSSGIDQPLLSGYSSNPDKDGDGFFDDKPYGQTWWADGPGWLVYVTSETIPITDFEATLSRIDKLIGTRFYNTKRGDHRLTVRRIDPVTGRTISQMPNISQGRGPSFSDDGQWIAVSVKKESSCGRCFPRHVGRGQLQQDSQRRSRSCLFADASVQ
ncbi:MAG: hypothetical protein WCJ09_23145 [Planctomycetota bacterium]